MCALMPNLLTGNDKLLKVISAFKGHGIKWQSPILAILMCLPVGLYSIWNPGLLTDPSDWKLIMISLLEETWLGGIESPQYFPIMADVLEPPS